MRVSRSTVRAAGAASLVRFAGALATLLACAGVSHAAQTPDAAMLQFPDVSGTDIVFVYGNDLWLVSRDGGVARPLASPPGRESFPKFSADGKTVAYIGNYEGNRDVYTLALDGGLSTRVTHHPGDEIVTDWSPDGKVIYYTSGTEGLARQQTIFLASAEGGNPQRVPVPYGTTATISPSGEWLAYTPHTHDFRTWKRYQGGWATDIWLFNLKNNSSRRVTQWEGTDTTPMFAPGNNQVLFYLSDDGPSHRANIWSIDLTSGARTQITKFTEFDVKWPSIGPGASGKGEIVFQHGPDLMLLDLATGTHRAVEVIIPGDRPTLRDQFVDFSKNIMSYALSPSGKRVLVSARGEVWNVPAEQGVTRRVTATAGVAERDARWSPDGKHIAYLSDATGEYELYIEAADGSGEPVRLTTDGAAFRYLRSWSPDSKRLLFADKTGAVFLHTLGGEKHDGSAPGTTVQVAKELWSSQTPASWSHDGAWIALALGHENTHNALWLYEVATGALTQVTSEMFDSTWPAFDRKGDWFYFVSTRSFTPTYSDIDSSFVYRSGDVILAVPLRADVKSPLLPRDDADDAKKDDKKAGAADAGPLAAVVGAWSIKVKGMAGPDDTADATFTFKQNDANALEGIVSLNGQEYALESIEWIEADKTLKFAVVADQRYDATLKIDGEKATGTWTAADGRTGALEGSRDKPDEAAKPIKIEFGEPGDFERRAIRVPVPTGSLANLVVSDSGKLIYTRADPARTDGAADLKITDFLDEKAATKVEEKNIASGVDSFVISADGKKLLIQKDDAGYVVDAAADQKLEKKVPLDAMTASVPPRDEWKQIFTEVWRLHRDFFYEAGLHNVDWKAVRARYEPLIDDCVTRDDVTYVIAEMISELNVGHAYYRPGDIDTGTPARSVGMLGADFDLVTQDGASAYRIRRIYEGAAWDSDARNPLREPGVDVKQGQFVLAVSGTPIDTTKDIYASFIGLAGKPVALTVSDKPVLDDTARTVVVKPVESEQNLRFRAWIEDNRRYTDEKSGGKIGYIYVINTGIPGQNDLFRQFYGQRHKAALIIDDRWNGGGQIPNRFIELLNRPRTNYWARRDGKDWAWPRDSHQGPKAMLINGLSASGGDMFPALFRQTGLGKLFGTRTWGGLVGISGNPVCIDGTMTNVPTFGYYETDGTWGIEGHGVDPDVEVLDDPAKMPQGLAPSPNVPAMGGDPQLDAAIAHLLEELKTKAYTPPARPAGPDRRGMGIPKSDW